MPARDIYHQAVCNALVKDGWTITHDPYTLTVGRTEVFIDLGAERLIAAEKGLERIAVETKSFVGASEVHDLEVAVGQYAFYRSLLQRHEAERKLFLAVTAETADGTLSEPIARPVLEDLAIAMMVFDPNREVIVRWTP